MILDAMLIQEDNPKRKEKVEDFKRLLNNVWEGLADWRKRGKSMPEEARGLGVIEPKVGHTIARRFKHRCASWTLHGAVNMAKVRCAVRNWKPDRNNEITWATTGRSNGDSR
ncbi:MAG: UPF0236 family transposase-like protein [Eubacteriales bacterium]